MLIIYRKDNEKRFNAELAKLIETYNQGTDILGAGLIKICDSDGNAIELNGAELLEYKEHYFKKNYQNYFFALVETASRVDLSWYNAMKPVLKEQLDQLKNKARQFNVVLNIDKQKLRGIEKDLMSKSEYAEYLLTEAVTGFFHGVAGSLTALPRMLLQPQKTASGLAYLATHKQAALDAAIAAIRERPVHTVARVAGSFGTGAVTGFFAGHEQILIVPVDHHFPMPNPDTLALVSQNGHAVLATAAMTHAINQPVLVATSGVSLATQASDASANLQIRNEKSDDKGLSSLPNKTDEEIIKFAGMRSTLFGTKSMLSDVHTAPHAALNC